MNENDFSSMSAAVKMVIESMPDGTVFYGSELHRAVVQIYPKAKNMYPDTMLRMMRRHCRDMVRVIDRNNSLYQKVGWERVA